MVIGGGDNLAPVSVLPPGSNSILSNAPFPAGGDSCGCGASHAPVAAAPVIGQPFIQPPASAAPVGGSCSGCGGGGCSSCGGSSGSGCQGCGSGGCFNPSEVDRRFAACGFISRARRYVLWDLLYFTRENANVQAFNVSPGGDLDFGFGTRLTIGTRQDAANGREFTYFGTFDINDSGTATDSLGRINSFFVPDGTFLGTGDLAPFSGVVELDESLETHFQSFEFNRVRWGWDVVKLIFGLRYTLLEDEYNASTTNIAGLTGTINAESTNHLIGPQIGGELFYDVGYRWSLSGHGKFAYFLNIFDTDLNLASDGFGIVNSGTEDGSDSYLFDLGLTAHYQLNTSSRFRIGYNLLFFGDVATADETLPIAISPFSSSSQDAEDDAFFHGLSLGFEFYR